MGNVNSFRDLVVWQKSHKLTLSIYQATDEYPDHEKFGLVNQMRRAAVSIPSNIAEGFGRPTRKDALRFYGIADASLSELKYQIILSSDLGYLKRDVFTSLENQTEELGKVLYGWIRANR